MQAVTPKIQLSLASGGQQKIVLQINQVEFHDSLIGLFDQLTDKLRFLTVSNTERVFYEDRNEKVFSFHFSIDQRLKLMSRRRYTIW